ncbi:MAG: hypothetical protein ACRD0G_09940 [Acidimicrobiales bacterium]
MWFLALMVVLFVAALSAPAARGEINPIGIGIASGDGRGRAVTPGRPCDDGGAGAYWHYEYGADLAPGVFSSLAGEALVHLDLHSDTQDFQNVEGVYPDPAEPSAFLQGAESHASLLNDRGSVKIRLRSGSCDEPTLAFDGSQASGTGTWEVESGTGAYRDVTGSGQLSVEAEVNPGADNALALNLQGAIDLPIPNLDVSVVTTYWGGLGTDYLSRRVSVVYRFTNTGPGDAFGVVVDEIENPPSSGVSPLASGPIALGDLPAGASTDRTIRHQLGLLGGTCTLIILGCDFTTEFTVNLPDALDNPHIQTDEVEAEAPLLPPPL